MKSYENFSHNWANLDKTRQVYHGPQVVKFISAKRKNFSVNKNKEETRQVYNGPRVVKFISAVRK